MRRWRGRYELRRRLVIAGTLFAAATLVFFGVTLIVGDRIELFLLDEVTLQKKELPRQPIAVVGAQDGPWRSLDGPLGEIQAFHAVIEAGATIVYGHNSGGLFRFDIGKREVCEIGQAFGQQAIRSVQIVPRSNGTHQIFVLTTSAIHASSDGGATWRALLAPGELQPPREPVLQGFSVADGPAGQVVAAVSRDELYWVENGRVEIREQATNLKSRHVGIVLMSHDGHLRCLLQKKGGISRAQDCRAPWQQVPELAGQTISNFWKRHGRQAQDEIAYAGTSAPLLPWLHGERLWRSSDGERWEKEATPPFLQYFLHDHGADCRNGSGETRLRTNYFSNHAVNLLLGDARGQRWRRLRLVDTPGNEYVSFSCPSTDAGSLLLAFRGGKLLTLDLQEDSYTEDSLTAPVATVRGLVVDPNGTIWAATKEGLYEKSSDTGWEEHNELKLGEIHALALGKATGKTELAIASDHGLVRGDLGKGSWRSDKKLGDRRVTALALDGQEQYVGGDDGVYHWQDDDWVRLDVLSAGEDVNALVALAKGIVMVGGERGVYVSLDGGKIFRRSRPTEIGANVLSVGAVNIDGFAALLAGTSEGAYVSRDLGLSWQRVFPDRGEMRSVTAVLSVNGDASGPTVYLGTVGTGVVWSRDLRHWNIDESGAARHVSALALPDPSADALLVGTFDRSVWELAAPHRAIP